MGGKSELMQREGNFPDRHTARLQVGSQPRKEAAEGAHQQQHRPLDGDLWRQPSPTVGLQLYTWVRLVLFAKNSSRICPQRRNSRCQSRRDPAGSLRQLSSSSIASSTSMNSPLRRLT